ncbi:hypothetical protein AB6A40_002171 [Gnathostoma spinigerum]|uniref:Uncharacterized protein n=1 Tax=Gnathostoma spinigerum TaxID=75299 RepID=A0ABD6E844_9BILA
MSQSYGKDKIVLHGCDLLNRHELSRAQDRELQRYINENSDILQILDRPAPGQNAPMKPKRRMKSPSVYASLREKLARGGGLRDIQIGDGSAAKNLTVSRSAGNIPRSIEFESKPTANWTTYTRPPVYTAKRKEVKWLDDFESDRRDPRAKSLSPIPVRRGLYEMSHYGSTGSLGTRGGMSGGVRSVSMDRTMSPAYSYLDKHQDDYNRYETARRFHSRQAGQQQHHEEEKSKFSGYGDRPGSGVELMPTKWHGGEIIRDRAHMPKSIKPKRMYYSPIGDGVVAADGQELVHQPKDLSPRISVTHTRTVERGEPGHDGYNLYERNIVHGGSDYSSDYGGGSGRNSRNTGTLSPCTDTYASGYGLPVGHDQHSQLSPAAQGYGSREQPGSYGHDILLDSPGGYMTGTKAPTYVSPAMSRTPIVDNSRTGNEANPIYASGPTVGRTSGSQGQYGPADGYNTSPRSVGGHQSPNLYSSRDSYVGSPRTDPYLQSPGSDIYATSGQFDAFRNSTNRQRSYSHDPYVEGVADAFVGDGRSSTISETYSRRSESSKRYGVTTDYLITNPRELIHQYATTTPVSVLGIDDQNLANTSKTVTKSFSSTTTEEKYAPYPPYKGGENTQHPNNFARQLRDENLTASQKAANLHQTPLNVKDRTYEQRLSEIRQASSHGPTSNEIDYLTEKMMYGLQTGHPTPPNL